MIKLALVFSLLSLSASAQVAEAPVPVKTIDVLGVVDFGMQDIPKEILRQAALPEVSEIKFLINSPGGIVDVGLVIVDAMNEAKRQGKKLKCYVGKEAASMAFMILSQCTERLATPHAKLLFHPPRFMGNFIITPESADTLKRVIERTDVVIWNMLKESMPGAKESWLRRNYREETDFYAVELEKQLMHNGVKWISTTTDFSEVGGAYREKEQTNVPFFFNGNGPNQGEPMRPVTEPQFREFIQ